MNIFWTQKAEKDDIEPSASPEGNKLFLRLSGIKCFSSLKKTNQYGNVTAYENEKLTFGLANDRWNSTFLQSMMLARGVVLLEAEAKQAVELKQRYMEENCAFAEFPSSMQELQVHTS